MSTQLSYIGQLSIREKLVDDDDLEKIFSVESIYLKELVSKKRIELEKNFSMISLSDEQVRKQILDEHIKYLARDPIKILHAIYFGINILCMILVRITAS
jgi:hypothetical protein